MSELSGHVSAGNPGVKYDDWLANLDEAIKEAGLCGQALLIHSPVEYFKDGFTPSGALHQLLGASLETDVFWMTPFKYKHRSVPYLIGSISTECLSKAIAASFIKGILVYIDAAKSRTDYEVKLNALGNGVLFPEMIELSMHGIYSNEGFLVDSCTENKLKVIALFLENSSRASSVKFADALELALTELKADRLIRVRKIEFSSETRFVFSHMLASERGVALALFRVELEKYVDQFKFYFPAESYGDNIAEIVGAAPL